jgi:hypothetical protein
MHWEIPAVLLSDTWAGGHSGPGQNSAPVSPFRLHVNWLKKCTQPDVKMNDK